MRKTFIFSLALSSLVAGCCAGQEKPTVEEASGISSRVVDCEQKAADRYDDGRSTISELAQRIISICAVELTKARLALNLSLHDPQIQLDELKHTAEIVGEARKSRARIDFLLMSSLDIAVCASSASSLSSHLLAVRGRSMKL
jgi:hypothetical protein